MCFSLQIDADIEKLCKLFNAVTSKEDFDQLYRMQQLEKNTAPKEMKRILGLKQNPKALLFSRRPDEEERIYPGTFTSVLTTQGKQRTFLPMRYRVRPHGSKEEIPSKYNVFNARLDSLEYRKTWSPLFMKKHALMPFKKFYEWVEWEDRSRLISFAPKDKEVMWAPALYDHWSSPHSEFSFYSFAIITTTPPPEIAQKGHDRCPIFLHHEGIEDWLHPEGQNATDIYNILGHQEEVTYESNWV